MKELERPRGRSRWRRLALGMAAAASGLVPAVWVEGAGAVDFGTISGTVTEQGTGTPIANVCVQAVTAIGEAKAFTSTGPSGTYTLGPMEVDDYAVQFLDCFEDVYATEYYNNVFDRGLATHVVNNGDVTGINASLVAKATISGQVTTAHNGQPLPEACVQVYSAESGYAVTAALANHLGQYTVRVDAGSYHIEFSSCSNPLYADEYYLNARTVATATPVEVTPPAAVTGINGALDLRGTISGIVTDAESGAGLDDVCAGLGPRPTGFVVASGPAGVRTVSGGHYSIGVGPGVHDVRLFGCVRGGPRVVEQNAQVTVNPGATTTVSRALTRATPRDLTGDGAADLAVYRPSAGRWYTNGVAGSVALGTATDIPVAADFDGDGYTERTVFRPASGRWYTEGTEQSIALGRIGDLPVPADYNGDHIDNPAVFRPSTGRWYITGAAYVSGTPLAWGQSGDIPVPADYDGDTDVDIAVYRPANGRWYRHGASGSVAFGIAGDVPVPADYDGNGTDDIAIFRPSTGRWYINGVAGSTLLGQAGDIPVPVDFDGDGDDDVAVYRPSTGRWFRAGVAGSVAFGLPGDIPVPKRVGT